MENGLLILRSPLEHSNINNHLEIGMGSLVSTEDTVVTHGVAPCIAIAAWNADTKQGLLAHFDTLISDNERAQSQREGLDEALSRISALGNIATTSLWIGGGSISTSTKNITGSVKNDRSYVESRVREFEVAKPQNTQIEWSKDDVALDLELDCQIGILAIHHSNAFRIPASTKKEDRLTHLISK